MHKMVSTRAAPSSQPGSTNFGRERRSPAQPASGGGHRNPAQPTSGKTKLVEPARERQRTAESKPPDSQKADPTTGPRTCTRWFRHGPLLRRSPAQPTSGGNVAGRLNRLQEGTSQVDSTGFGRTVNRSSCGDVRTCVRRHRPGPASRRGCRNADSRSRDSDRTPP